MAELTHKERLLPSLLDRLTDDRPKVREESRHHRAGNISSLRESVLRDLEWLMNTVNLESVVSLDAYPEIRDTVLNYGMPGLSGSTLNTADRESIKELIKDAIETFEPRILKNTLRVSLIEDKDMVNPHAIAFQIEGTMWGRPMPEALFLRTELDLELGDVKVTEA
ncbi:MAG: type VI secretion system baseplate subunit TssE [Granulosicoccus sp.]|nr:type VI secretion system baseplate subunit TssE [Granulosicoccus sp.]